MEKKIIKKIKNSFKTLGLILKVSLFLFTFGEERRRGNLSSNGRFTPI